MLKNTNKLVSEHVAHLLSLERVKIPTERLPYPNAANCLSLAVLVLTVNHNLLYLAAVKEIQLWQLWDLLAEVD